VNWPIDSRSSAAFRGIVLAVVLAHGAGLWQMQSAHPQLRRGHSQGALIFSGQLLPPLEAVRPTQDALPAGGFSRADATTGSVSASPAAVTLPDPPIAGEERPPLALGQAFGHSSDGAFLDYLPRSRLTVVPRPLTPVQVPFPEQVAGIVDLRVVVSLFIDETGAVRRVRLDNPAVPPAFAQVIMDTFLATPFKAGEVETVPVRSQLRLEIEFRTGAASR
jgi:hypothetical protein